MKNNIHLYKLIAFVVLAVIISRIFFTYFINFNQFIELISKAYGSYGSIILFFSGFIEATVVIGLYFPGSTIILIGATLAGTRIISLPSVIIWTTLGIILAYSLNYWLGKVFGEKLADRFGMTEQFEKAQTQARKSKLIYLWGAFHPNIAAVTSVAFGAIGADFRFFLLGMSLSQLFWSSLWTVIFYFFGLLILNKIAAILGIIVILLFLVEAAKIFLHKRKQKIPVKNAL